MNVAVKGRPKSGVGHKTPRLTEMEQCDVTEQEPYASPAFLCRKVREAFQSEQPDLLANFVHQLACALRSPHPEDLQAVFQFDIISILVKFATGKDFPWLRNYAVNCLVSLSACDQPNVRSALQSPRFCDLAIELVRTLPRSEVAQAIQLLANILCARIKPMHEYVVSKLDFEYLIEIVNTCSGNVLEEVLFCLKVLAWFPLKQKDANATLRVLALAARDPQQEYAITALEVMLRLILSKSLDIAEFNRLGLFRFVSQCLESPLQRIVSMACKVINKLYTDYEFSDPSVIPKIIEQLESDKPQSGSRDEAVASCVAALTAILSKEHEARRKLVLDGFVSKLMRIFASGNVRSKVLIIILLDVIVSQCDQPQFAQIMASQTPECSVVSCAMELLELQFEEEARKCAVLLQDFARAGERFEFSEQVRTLLHGLDAVKSSNKEVQDLIQSLV